MSGTLSSWSDALPGRHRWNQAEFYRIAALGIFAPHAAAVTLSSEALRPLLPPEVHLRVQLPLAVSAENEPLSDIAIVAGKPRNYLGQHPQTARLILEISDTTLAYDQNVKSALYAAANAPEYGVLDIRTRTLYVYRAPQPLTDAAGYGYAERQTYGESDQFVSRELPTIAVAVADLLP